LFRTSQSRKYWINEECYPSYDEKHIDIQHHYFKETMNDDEVVLEYCLMLDMGVDILNEINTSTKTFKMHKDLKLQEA